jgi:hypothetical protein
MGLWRRAQVDHVHRFFLQQRLHARIDARHAPFFGKGTCPVDVHVHHGYQDGSVAGRTQGGRVVVGDRSGADYRSAVHRTASTSACNSLMNAVAVIAARTLSF